MTIDEEKMVLVRRALQYLKDLLENVDKVTESSEFAGVFVISSVHGLPYAGPVFDRQLFAEARKFLADHQDYLKPGD